MAYTKHLTRIAMRLLLVAQTVDINDPVLGFFHTWIASLSRQVANVTVICLREGEHTLPEKQC